MINRNNHDNDYTVLPNSLLQHSAGLDPESLGVLVYLLSHPANWRVYGTEIAKHFDISTDRVTRITKRLQKQVCATRSPPPARERCLAGIGMCLIILPEIPDPHCRKKRMPHPQIPDLPCRKIRHYKVIRSKKKKVIRKRRHSAFSRSKKP